MEKLYKREKALDNTPRTIVAKERAFADLLARRGEKPIGDYTLDDAVAHKNVLIEEGGSARRVNAKLSFQRDRFGYAIDNGHREDPNPFETAKVAFLPADTQNSQGIGKPLLPAAVLTK